MEKGRFRNNPSWIQIGCTIFDMMWERGWDKEHGGLLNFTDLHGLPVMRDCQSVSESQKSVKNVDARTFLRQSAVKRSGNRLPTYPSMGRLAHKPLLLCSQLAL